MMQAHALQRVCQPAQDGPDRPDAAGGRRAGLRQPDRRQHEPDHCQPPRTGAALPGERHSRHWPHRHGREGHEAAGETTSWIDMSMLLPGQRCWPLPKTANGKRTDPEQYREQGRNGMGIKAMNLTEKTACWPAIWRSIWTRIFCSSPTTAPSSAWRSPIFGRRAAPRRACG